VLELGNKNRNRMTKPYVPPKGSQVFPHPRSIADIVFRSIFIHICAYLAYAQLLQLIHYKRPSGRQIPGSHYILPLLSLFFPELITIQLGFWLLDALFHRKRQTYQASNQQGSSPLDNGILSFLIGGTLTRWAFKNLLFSATCLIPFVAAGIGYKERLNMRYHEANYVGALLIDHRTGWIAASGVLCTIITATIVSYNLISRSNNRSSSLSEHAYTESTISTHSRSVLSEPQTLLELSLAVLIHQIPLGATNHKTLISYLAHHPYLLLLPPLFFISTTKIHTSGSQIRTPISILLHLRSASSTEIKLVLRNVAVASLITLIWGFTSVTAILQFLGEVSELVDVAHGVVLPWNYRWRVKDAFSFGDRDRVYLG
jgi:hypothetical protein